MKIDIITIFPEIFSSVFSFGNIRKAIGSKELIIKIHDLRQWADNKYQSVDDHPYGGGPGMILRIEPIFKALEAVKKEAEGEFRTIVMGAKGKEFTQKKAIEYRSLKHLVIICGRYEGIDERVITHLADEEISIGKYILSGGEIPAMAIVDSIARLMPGVVGNADSLKEESFADIDKTEYPQYTRPEVFKTLDGKELKVPEVLLSGNHKEIADWRHKKRKPAPEKVI